MGFFGTYLYEDGHWHDVEPGIRPEPGLRPDGGHWLLVDIHDSDFTTVHYHPPGPGTGLAYLGVTPRTYFENPDASTPTDTAREAAGLTAWWESLRSNADDRHDTPAGRRVAKESELIAFLAQDVDPEDDDLDDGDEDDVDALDDAEVFVEIKTARLLAALDLPLPAELDR